MTIKERLNNDVKDAMRAKDKELLSTLRLITAAVKQVEVDERIEVDDERMLVILDKMSKQRKESIAQYEKANREDLVAQEQYELDVTKKIFTRTFICCRNRKNDSRSYCFNWC